MNSGASEGTSQTESSEKIKPVSFAIVELHWSGIRQAGRQLVG